MLLPTRQLPPVYACCYQHGWDLLPHSCMHAVPNTAETCCLTAVCMLFPTRPRPAASHLYACCSQQGRDMLPHNRMRVVLNTAETCCLTATCVLFPTRQRHAASQPHVCCSQHGREMLPHSRMRVVPNTAETYCLTAACLLFPTRQSCLTAVSGLRQETAGMGTKRKWKKEKTKEGKLRSVNMKKRSKADTKIRSTKGVGIARACHMGSLLRKAVDNWPES